MGWITQVKGHQVDLFTLEITDITGPAIIYCGTGTLLHLLLPQPLVEILLHVLVLVLVDIRVTSIHDCFYGKEEENRHKKSPLTETPQLTLPTTLHHTTTTQS